MFQERDRGDMCKRMEAFVLGVKTADELWGDCAENRKRKRTDHEQCHFNQFKLLPIVV